MLLRLSQAAKNSGSGQGLGSGPGSHTTTANKVETLKEEEEELKRKVEQCKVRGAGGFLDVRVAGVGAVPTSQVTRGDVTCPRPRG